MNRMTLSNALAELQIPNEWDALIVGDGSGTGWEGGCGWAAILCDHYGSYRKLFYGGWSSGTSYIGELMPYIEALTWYASGPGKGSSHSLGMNENMQSRRPIQVHIVTDNANVANQGNRRCDRGAYPWLWDALVGIERQGFVLHWHWLERERLALNRLADMVSVASRVAMESLPKLIEERHSLAVETMLYEFNPEDPNACIPSTAPQEEAGKDGG